jgi:hypothetical protein
MSPPSQRGYGTLNAHAPAGAQQPPKPQNQPSASGGAGGGGSSSQAAEDARPPPTYAEAVRGDHKVQDGN